MSEYTPTTDVVRSLYSGESTDGKESNKEFDRWLAAYKAKTIARTEERIIKLLETYIEAYGAPEEKIARNLFTRAIREIKGEQK